MKLVTVIVPVYNVKNYIKRCLQSIIDQTYRNLEIILVDDGSSDGSNSICKYFSTKDNRIKIYRTENLGLSHARNIGLDNANGDYIIFVDSDDYISKDMISIMMHKAEDADLVICNYNKILDDDNTETIQDKKVLINNEWDFKEFWVNYYKGNLTAFCCVAWNKLYKKRLFNNVRYPLNKIHEDEYIINEIVSRCNRIKVINDSLYYYVQRPNSIMHSRYKGNLEKAEAFLSRCNSFQKHNLTEIIKENLNEIPGLLITGLYENNFSKESKNRYYCLRKEYFFYSAQYLRNKFSAKLYLKQCILIFPRLYLALMRRKSNK